MGERNQLHARRMRSDAVGEAGAVRDGGGLEEHMDLLEHDGSGRQGSAFSRWAPRRSSLSRLCVRRAASPSPARRSALLRQVHAQEPLRCLCCFTAAEGCPRHDAVVTRSQGRVDVDVESV